MQKPNYHKKYKDNRIRINEAIRSQELRVVGPQGENFGTMSRIDALKKSSEFKLDLIVISPKSKPPVAKITDYGQYRYDTKQKASKTKAKSNVTETKNAQVKIGTSEHDQQMKAKRVATWLKEGHRVRIDLFLWGRYKYMETGFLKERLERFLRILPVEYKVADPIKKSPKGFSTTIEKSLKTKQQDAKKELLEIDKTVNKKNGQVSKSKKKTLDELMNLI